jgi:hypothetical protein
MLIDDCRLMQQAWKHGVALIAVDEALQVASHGRENHSRHVQSGQGGRRGVSTTQP